LVIDDDNYGETSVYEFINVFKDEILELSFHRKIDFSISSFQGRSMNDVYDSVLNKLKEVDIKIIEGIVCQTRCF